MIAATGLTRADPIASLAVGVLILPRTWRLLRDAVDVLLEASPRGIDLSEVRQHMTGLAGVLDVHDLHAWTITSGLPVLSAHVVVDPVAWPAAAAPACWTGCRTACAATSTSSTPRSSSSPPGTPTTSRRARLTAATASPGIAPAAY